jgi:hypothetical protein
MAGAQKLERCCQPANSSADNQGVQGFLHAKANDITSACDPDCNRSLLDAPPSRDMTSGESAS